MRTLLHSLIILLIFPILASSAQAPKIPHAFFGQVTINGSPAPIGTMIEAQGDGVRVGIAGNPLQVETEGLFGGPGGFDPKLLVQGEVAENTTIIFLVDGTQAECALPGADWQEGVSYQSGAITELQLRVGSQDAPVPTTIPTATALPAPTDTPLPTPIHTATVAVSSASATPSALAVPSQTPIATATVATQPTQLPVQTATSLEQPDPPPAPTDLPTSAPSLTAEPLASPASTSIVSAKPEVPHTATVVSTPLVVQTQVAESTTQITPTIQAPNTDATVIAMFDDPPIDDETETKDATKLWLIIISMGLFALFTIIFVKKFYR